MNFLRIAALVLVVALPALADWTQFRGPHGSGVAEGSVPLKWSSHEHLVWKTSLPGPGTSSPIVVGSKVFVTCWSGYGDGGKGEMAQLVRHLVCLNKTSGKVLWDRTVPPVLPEDPFEGMITEHGYASSTPVSDGESVYVFFGKTGVLAFDLEGKQRWQTSVGTHTDDKHWGSAASPILFKDLVVVNALTEGGAVVALDKSTGRQVWKTADERVQLAYGTPVLVDRGQGMTDIVLAVPDQLWGIDPATGKLNWQVAHGLGGDVAPNAVLESGILYVMGGSPKQGAIAVAPGGKQSTPEPAILWRSNNSSYVPTPIFHEGHLYVINDQGFALCMDAKTGKEIYRERALDHANGPRRGGGGQPFYASPVLVNGRIYCPSRRNGTFVVAAKPEFELLAVNVIEGDESQFNASPAVDANRIFIRSDRFLYCIGE